LKSTVRYETLSHLKQTIKGIKNYHEQPLECRWYGESVEKNIGVKIAWIGTEPDRDDSIAR
jgi:adenylosuccinate synthase